MWNIIPLLPNLVVLGLTLCVLHSVGWVDHYIVDADLSKVTPILGGLQPGRKKNQDI